MVSVLAVATLHAQAPQQNEDISKVVRFKELDHDFGKIPYGKPAEFTLDMKNVPGDSVTSKMLRLAVAVLHLNGSPDLTQQARISILLSVLTVTPKASLIKLFLVYFKGGLSQLIKFSGETFKAPDNAAPGMEPLAS